MLHDHMVVARLMLYEKSIEECKLKRIVRNFERGGSSDLEKTRVKKSAQTQEEPRIAKEKFDKGVGSQNEKPTCVTCGMRHYGKCLTVITGCFCFGKDNHKVKDCTIIAARGRERVSKLLLVFKRGCSKGKGSFLCTPGKRIKAGL